MYQLARSVATGSLRYIYRRRCAAPAADDHSGFGLAAAISVPAGAANIVTNGSFETGDFTGWVPLNNIGFSGVECPEPPAAPQGNCFGFFGPVGCDGSIAQGLNTLPGRFYTISFDFNPEAAPAGREICRDDRSTLGWSASYCQPETRYHRALSSV